MASAETGRRNFIKYAATAIVCGVIAGVGGWFAGSAAVPPPKTITKTLRETTTVTAPVAAPTTVTVTAPPTTVTERITETVTVKPTPPAPKGTPIKIGHMPDLTGALASYGVWQKIAFEQAVKKINEEEGGIDGRPVEIAVEDTATKTDVGLAAFKKLALEFKADFIVGTTHSGVAMACAPLAKELKIPWFMEAPMSHRCTEGDKGNRWIFRYVSQVRQQTKVFARIAAEIAKKWTTYYWDYAWGQSHDIWFTRELEKWGGKVVGHVPIPLGTAEHMPYIAKIPKETEVLYPVLFGAPSITLLKQLYEAGFWGEIGMVICTIDAIATEPLKEILEGVWVLEYWPRLLRYDDTPYNREFRKRYGCDELGRSIKDPTKDALWSHIFPAWMTPFMIKEAIEATGWKDRKDNPKVIKYLEGAVFKQSYWYPQRDSFFRAQDHQGFHPHYLSRIEKGRLHVKEYLDIEDIWFEPEVPTDFTKEPL